MLRLAAVLIAIAGMVDPAVTVSRSVRQPLMITVLGTPSLALPDESGTRGDRAYRSAETLSRSLDAQYTVTVREQPADSTADPCPADEACIMVSDGARPRVLHARQGLIGAVHVGSALTPNVAIVGVNSPREASSNAMASVDVDLEAHGFGGRTTNVEVLDDDVSVGAGSYTWPTGEAGVTARATLRLEWAPLASGSRDVRVVVAPAADEVTTIDNEARTATVVTSQTDNVLVYEPQPSWGSTFVRRALEADPRFKVVRRARLGPTHMASSTSVTLRADALERDNVAVVIVASPQLLTRDEADALERLVRLRGAAVVLLLEATPAGEIARLLRATGVERREPAPVALGALTASELIVLRPHDRATTVVASTGADVVILSRALGQGHVIASGVVDAWRFRADSAFDAFWRSLIADAAQAAGTPLALSLSRGVVATGEPVEVDVEWRSVHEINAPLEAEGVLRCGSEETPLRLWPSSLRGRFRGAFDAPSPGECTVDVNIQRLGSASASVRVTDKPAGPIGQRADLATAIRAHGGTTVAAGDEAALVTRFRSPASPQHASTAVHPMRSPWWIAPFTACLSVEWWRRRRRGLL